MNTKEMKETIQLYDRLAYLESKESLRAYIDRITIDSRPPQRLKHIIQPWQSDLYNILIPLFESAAGFPSTTDKKAAFITAGKGSSKTSMIAQLVSWVLCFAKRPVTAICAAADKEQASILLDRIQKETAHNPWLKLVFRNYEVDGPTGTLKVLSSDASTAQGYIPDLIVCDELTFWKRRDLADALLSGRNKRKDCIFIILSNAGVLGTWQADVWNLAGESNQWIQYAVPSFSANWMSKESIEDDKKMLLPILYKRLHENQWADPSEDSGFLSIEQLQHCVTDKWEYQTKGKNHHYVIGIDGGIVRDRTAACLCHMEDDNVFIDRLDVWQPSRKDRMPIELIENWIADCLQNFNVRSLVLDKTNLEQLAQKFERRLNVERFSFHGDSHHKMAENIRSLVLNQRLTIYPNAGYVEKSDGSYDTLVTEIANLIVVERAGLYRLDHRPGFHDDAYCFIKGTQIETENGPLPIELVKAGMKVLTRQGYKIVSNAGFTRVAPIFKLTTDDKILYGTGNHPIYCNGEWVAMENIKANDTIYTWKMHQMKSNGTVSHTDAIQNQSIYHTDDTIKRTHNGKARLDTCTGTYGKLPMEQFHLNTISTIKTETHSTMNYQILNAFHQENTLTNTIINGSATKLLNQNESKQCGMDLTNGARSEQKHYHQTETKWSAFAFSAETYSRRTSIDLPKLVPIVVRHVMDMGIHQPVYNLTVEDSPEYFANGLLVHNCATAMACLEAVKYRTMPKFHFNAAPEPISPMPRKQTPIDVAAIEREKLKNAKWD